MRSDRRAHSGALPETSRQVGPKVEQTWWPTGLLDLHDTVRHVTAPQWGLILGKERTPRHANAPIRDRGLFQTCQEHIVLPMKSASETVC